MFRFPSALRISIIVEKIQNASAIPPTYLFREDGLGVHRISAVQLQLLEGRVSLCIRQPRGIHVDLYVLLTMWQHADLLQI